MWKEYSPKVSKLLAHQISADTNIAALALDTYAEEISLVIPNVNDEQVRKLRIKLPERRAFTVNFGEWVVLLADHTVDVMTHEDFKNAFVETE